MPVEELLIYVYVHFNHSAKRKDISRISRVSGVLWRGTFKDPEARQHTVAELREMRQPLSAAVAGIAKLLWTPRESWTARPLKRYSDYLTIVEKKAYFMFLSFILDPLNAFNTIFQTDATQIAILIPEIAYGNADSERVFSMVRKIDTDSHSQFGNNILRALLSCKINTDEPCYAFAPDKHLC